MAKVCSPFLDNEFNRIATILKFQSSSRIISLENLPLKFPSFPKIYVKNVLPEVSSPVEICQLRRPVTWLSLVELPLEVGLFVPPKYGAFLQNFPFKTPRSAKLQLPTHVPKMALKEKKQSSVLKSEVIFQIHDRFLLQTLMWDSNHYHKPPKIVL